MIEFYNQSNYCLGLGSTVRDRNPKLPGLKKRKGSISYKIQKAVQGWYYGCTFRLRCFIPSSVFTFQVIEGSTSLLHSLSRQQETKREHVPPRTLPSNFYDQYMILQCIKYDQHRFYSVISNFIIFNSFIIMFNYTFLMLDDNFQEKLK